MSGPSWCMTSSLIFFHIHLSFPLVVVVYLYFLLGPQIPIFSQTASWLTSLINTLRIVIYSTLHFIKLKRRVARFYFVKLSKEQYFWTIEDGGIHAVIWLVFLPPPSLLKVCEGLTRYQALCWMLGIQSWIRQLGSAEERAVPQQYDRCCDRGVSLILSKVLSGPKRLRDYHWHIRKAQFHFTDDGNFKICHHQVWLRMWYKRPSEFILNKFLLGT